MAVMNSTSPALDPATAKFISISNVLGGIQRFDRGSFTTRDMRPKIASALAGTRKPGPFRALTRPNARQLRIAWQTELAARVSDQIDDDMLRRVSAQTLPVHAYYAVFNAARAATSARGTACATHQAVHRDFQSQRVRNGQRSWGVALTGDPEDPTRCVIEPAICVPAGFNAMELSRAPSEYVFSALRMTRRWKVDSARADWLKTAKTAKGLPRKQLPASERAKLVSALRPTTIFDFLYELRVRTNYQGVEEYGSDADDFIVGQFHAGLLHLLDIGLLHYETDLAVTIGLRAYEAEVDGWTQSTATVGTWARVCVERRLSAIRAAIQGPTKSTARRRT